MIAKKHAQSYMPNGEVSLEQVIQAAIDEAIAAYVNYPEYRDKNELQERIRQLEYDKKIYLARAEASEADYARVVGRNRQLEAERVPEGWVPCAKMAITFADAGLVSDYPANAEAHIRGLAGLILRAAAPAQEKV